MPWSPIAPPTYFSNLPQIIPPQQQAPDTGTQMNSLATGAAQRQLMGQQTQDAATQNQANQIAVQQAQMDLQDQQKWRQIYQQSKGVMSDAIPAAVAAGIGPRTLQPIQTAYQTYQIGQAKLTEDQLNVHNLQLDGMHGLLGPVLKIQDPVLQKQAWDKMNADGVSAGYQTAAHASENPYPGGQDGVTQYGIGLTTLKFAGEETARQQAAARQTTADTSKTREDAELPGQQADAAQKVKARAASDLASTTNPADYDARLNQYIHDEGGSRGAFPPSVQVFDSNNDWLPNQQAIVNRSGLTSQQSTQADLGQGRIDSHEDIVAAQQAGANSRAAGVQAGANARADDRASGVQGRFDARQGAGLTKQLGVLQTGEDKIHATRTQIYTDLNNPNTSDVQKGALQARLAMTRSQIQSFQTRKATLMGVQSPPDAFAATIAEGQTANSPDGHVWKKSDGITYLVK